jgi:hypothetical protein
MIVQQLQELPMRADVRNLLWGVLLVAMGLVFAVHGWGLPSKAEAADRQTKSADTIIESLKAENKKLQREVYFYERYLRTAYGEEVTFLPDGSVGVGRIRGDRVKPHEKNIHGYSADRSRPLTGSRPATN